MERDVARERDGDQAAWRDLVARLQAPLAFDPASAPWPETENLHDGAPPARDAGLRWDSRDRRDPDEAADRGRVIRPAGVRRPAEPPESPDAPGPPGRPDSGDLDEAGEFAAADSDVSDIGYLDDLDDGDCYVSPPLAPPPPVDPVTRGAWIALFGGPSYLFLAAILGWQLSGWAELAAMAAFVIGFVVLVLRLGDGPSRRDGPDQGAVV